MDQLLFRCTKNSNSGLFQRSKNIQNSPQNSELLIVVKLLIIPSKKYTLICLLDTDE